MYAELWNSVRCNAYCVCVMHIEVIIVKVLRGLSLFSINNKNPQGTGKLAEAWPRLQLCSYYLTVANLCSVTFLQGMQ